MENVIRERARELWEQAGQPEGRDWDFWFEAERQNDCLYHKYANMVNETSPWQAAVISKIKNFFRWLKMRLPHAD